MPLATLQRAHRNPKVHDTAGIRASISRHGYVEPIVMDERTSRLVAGHGRLDDFEARKAAGESPPEGVRLGDEGEWEIPVWRGWASASDADAEAYLVGSNELAGRGGWDQKRLAEIFGTYREDADWFLGTGYTPDEGAALLHSTGLLTREAVDFLGTAPAAGADEEGADLSGLEGWVAINFTVHADQRAAILETLDRIRRQESLGTRAEALVALCRRG